MKKFFLLLVLISSFVLYSEALQESGLSRCLSARDSLDKCNLSLRVTNYGCCGEFDTPYGLAYPHLGNAPLVEYLYKAGLWVGGQKYRRNSDGDLYYWLPDATSEDDVVTENDEQWTPDLIPVLDTLTTVGFDGDLDLMEFLPAYNPWEMSQNDLYDQYNSLDTLMHGFDQLPGYDDDMDGLVDEDNMGRPFELMDSQQTWCFTIPTDDEGDSWIDEDWGHNGYESTLGYYYDYSPFGTPGDRDWGNSNSISSHYPLGLAVKQETWSYPVYGLEDVVFINYQITNSSQIDTLKYLAYGFYLDADIGPLGQSNIAYDDVSTYQSSGSYEYASSYDFDGDEGLADQKLALMILDSCYAKSCYSWQVGDGPDDCDPLNVFGAGIANEKYQLMTGRNPNSEKYLSLILDPHGQENSGGLDTRFLFSTYGAMPHTGDMDDNGFADYLETDANGSTFLRYDLQPLVVKDITVVLCIADNIDEFSQKLMTASEFAESGYDHQFFSNYPSYPVITNTQLVDQEIYLNWTMLTMPDSLWVKYKLTSQPEDQWQYIEVNHGAGHYQLSEISQYGIYNLQIEASYDGLHLNSRPAVYDYFSNLDEGSDSIAPAIASLQVYPNPFNPELQISFCLSELEDVEEIAIYNIRGQCMRSYNIENNSQRNNRIVWDGKDSRGKAAATGIYFVKMKTTCEVYTVKTVLMK